MKINKLVIDNKEFDFRSKNTLIYSKKNSVGKTTLIRLLLYSLGYKIPATKGLKFKDLKLSVELIEKDQKIKIDRMNNQIVTNLLPDTTLNVESTDDMSTLHSMIYNADIPELLNNILGLFYFDQEKGWTLLNRGTVIGGIRFNIEELIEGLDKPSLLELESKKDKLTEEKNIYIQLNKLVRLQEEYTGKGYSDDKSTLELQDEYRSLKMELQRLDQEIKGYVKIQKDNVGLIKLIEQSGIRVNVNGKEIPVTRENIVNYNTNQKLLNAQLTRKRNFKKEYEKLIYNVREQLNQKLQLVNVEDQLTKFSNFLSENDFNTDGITLLISKYTSQIEQLNKKKKNELYHSDLTIRLYHRIKKYSSLLEVEDSIDDGEDFIFTSNLKRYSGAKLHLLVFAFRMALLKEVQKIINITLPIILDSPRTGELDKNNLALMFKLLEKEFPDNQIIVASVISSEDLFELQKWENIIELKKYILE